jgi:uncharacterized protein (TIGR02646 family)
MFKVTRPHPGPNCSKNYRSKEVVAALQRIFHGKCYLCEDEVADPVVEHFIPHEGDRVKKYDWNNLYYACHRCNNIKGTTTTELLDCCDVSIDVFKAVKCLSPSVPDDDIIIEPQDTQDKTKNTAALLKKCYNENNTEIRRISRANLHEKIFDYYTQFITYRMILKSRDSLCAEKNDAQEHIRNMMRISYPFSVFWRWHVLSDSRICDIFQSAILNGELD